MYAAEWIQQKNEGNIPKILGIAILRSAVKDKQKEIVKNVNLHII